MPPDRRTPAPAPLLELLASLLPHDSNCSWRDKETSYYPNWSCSLALMKFSWFLPQEESSKVDSEVCRDAFAPSRQGIDDHHTPSEWEEKLLHTLGRHSTENTHKPEEKITYKEKFRQHPKKEMTKMTAACASLLQEEMLPEVTVYGKLFVGFYWGIITSFLEGVSALFPLKSSKVIECITRSISLRL